MGIFFFEKGNIGYVVLYEWLMLFLKASLGS
jgi:hypothetical protein